MKIKIILLTVIGVIILLVFGIASAQLNQNIQTDSSTFEEPNCNQCDGLGNCERTCNSDCNGECDGSCNCIKQRNCNREYDPGEQMCNKRCSSRNGIRHGSGNCCK